MIIKIKSDITGKEYSGNNMEELVAQCEADDKEYNKTLETKKKDRKRVLGVVQVLEKSGIKIENENYKTFKIKKNQKYQPLNMSVPGDFSQCCPFVAAALFALSFFVSYTLYYRMLAGACVSLAALSFYAAHSPSAAPKDA